MEKQMIATKIWGIEWFKGVDGRGAQAYLIPKVTDQLLLAIHHDKKGRQWAIATKEQYLNLISKNRSVYEVIMDRKRKVYFDIDAETDQLDLVVKEIKAVLKDAKLCISGSTKIDSEGKVLKYSYHITVSNYFLNNVSECAGLKGFCKKFSSLGFDWKVYTINRQMKCVNQSKIGREVQEYISGSKDLKDHTITMFFENDCEDASSLFEPFVSEEEPMVYNKIKQQRLMGPKSDVFIGEPIELVKLIPSTVDHSITWTVAMYYAKLGLSFDDFWIWAARKDNSVERYNKYLNYHWPNIQKITQAGNNRIGKDQILRILERYFPNIRKEYYTRVFLEYSEIPFDVDTEREYMLESDITNDRNINYLVQPMGSNKTGAVVKYVDNTNNSCIFINCRKSLAQNLKGRLPSKFVSYDDHTHLRKVCKENGYELKASEKHAIKKIGIPLCEHLITTPNSVHHIGERNYDIVVIDEFELYQTVWISDTTHTVVTKNGEQNNYVKNWDTMTRILKNAKKIIIMDALPSRNAFLSLFRLGYTKEQITIIGSSFKYKKISIVEVKPVGKSCASKVFIQKIIDVLNEGEKVYIFYPYVTPSKKLSLDRLTCNQLLDLLQKHVKRDIKGIIYTKDTNKGEVYKGLLNVDESWKDVDVVIVNQSVTIGVNYSVPNQFHSVFLADASFVSARELVQTSRRIRHTKTDRIYYVNLGGKPRDTIFKGQVPNDKIIQESIEDIFAEYKAKNSTTLHHLFEKGNIVFETDKEAFKNLPKVYKKYLAPDANYEWNLIPEISDPEVYERLCLYGAECCEDVLKLAKYQFRRMFKEIPEQLIRSLWADKNLVIKVYTYLKSKERFGWITELLEKIKCKGKFTISAPTKAAIFKNFSFTRLDFEKVSDQLLCSKALNSYFAFDVYSWKKQSHRVEYNLNTDFTDVLQHVETFGRLSQELNMLFEKVEEDDPEDLVGDLEDIENPFEFL